MNEGLSNKSGFTLIEVIFAVAVFSMITNFVIAGVIYSQKTANTAGKRGRAILLAEEGLEAVRSIRDTDFSSLSNGNHGLTINNNQWELSGSSEQIDLFNRQISIAEIDTNTKEITSTVTWQQTEQRDGEVILTSYLTNWQEYIPAYQSDSLAVDITNASLDNSKKFLENIIIENIGPLEITIDKIQVFWPSSDQLREIKINNDKVWSKNGPGSPSGDQYSGTIIDIEDVVIPANSDSLEINHFKFTKKMNNMTFDIIFIMADESTLEIYGINP